MRNTVDEGIFNVHYLCSLPVTFRTPGILLVLFESVKCIRHLILPPSSCGQAVKLRVLTKLPFLEPDVLVSVKRGSEVSIAMSSFSQTNNAFAFGQCISHLNSAVDPATVE